MLDEHEAVARKYYPNMFSTDTLAKKQEALLVEENPTILEVQDLRIESFLGDREQFLTLQVENISKLTAQNVKLDIRLPVVDGHAVMGNGLFLPNRRWHVELQRPDNLPA